jgi:anti-anti-sigma factor
VLSTPTGRSSALAEPLLSVRAVPGIFVGTVVVGVVGEVDTFTAPALGVCLHSQATQPGVRDLIVDLHQVTFFGAAGVSVLAQASSRCRMRGGRLVIRCGGRRSVLRPLQLTGFASDLAIDPPEPERRSTGASRTATHTRPGPRRTRAPLPQGVHP